MASLKGYLTVIGYVKDSTAVTWRLGYLSNTEDPTYAQRLHDATRPPVAVAQVDATGSVISTYPIPTNDLHAYPVDEDVFLFAGKLPLDDATRGLTLSLQEKQLATFAFPDHPPELRLTWQPDAGAAHRQTITWEARHPDGAAMEFTVFYSNDGGQSYRPLSQSIAQMAYTTDFDLLPGGNGQIMVQATDGGNMVTAKSPVFPVPIRPILPMILSPEDQANVQGAWVTLQGQGYDLEADRPELEALVWTSSVSGRLGTGRTIQVSLSPGTHTIRLAAGTGDRQGVASITVYAT